MQQKNYKYIQKYNSIHELYKDYSISFDFPRNKFFDIVDLNSIDLKYIPIIDAFELIYPNKSIKLKKYNELLVKFKYHKAIFIETVEYILMDLTRSDKYRMLNCIERIKTI